MVKYLINPRTLLYPLNLLLLLSLSLFAYVYWGAITGQQVIIHGDNLIHRLGIEEYYASMLKNDSWTWWAREDAMGFPIYAEGQGSFFHPINFLAFKFLPLLTAHNWVSLIHILLAGFGCFFYCRLLHINSVLSTAVTLMMCFSPGFMNLLYNPVYLQTFAWGVWTFACFEFWYERRTFQSLLSTSLCVVLMILSGYPQITYTFLLFLSFIMIIRFAFAIRGKSIKTAFSESGILEFSLIPIIAIALTTFQILPLFELSYHSIRKEIVEVEAYLPASFYARGFFLSDDLDLYSIDTVSSIDTMIFPAMASVLMIFIVLMLPNIHSKTTWGYLWVSIIFAGLLMGPLSPFFRFFYDYLPGFDKFRTALPFSLTTILTVPLIWGLCLQEFSQTSWTRISKYASLLFLTLGTFYSIYLAQILPIKTDYLLFLIVIFVASLLGAKLLLSLKKPQGIAWLLLMLVVFEIFYFKQSYLQFMEVETFTKHQQQNATVPYLKYRSNPTPEHEYALKQQLRQLEGQPPQMKLYSIQQHPDSRSIHYPNTPYINLGIRLAFDNSKSPKIKDNIREAFQNIMPYLHLGMHLNFIESHNGLPLYRKKLLEEELYKELKNEGTLPVGKRLIDQFMIRFVHVQAPPRSTPFLKGLLPAYQGSTPPVTIYENLYANRFHRFYTQTTWADTPEQALELLPKNPQSLILEKTSLPQITEPLTSFVRFLGLDDTLSSHDWNVKLPSDGYLFVPIPSYPGWNLWIDGQQQPLYPAQVAGQGFPVSKGKHHLRLEFFPMSFYLGLAISVMTLCLIILKLLIHRKTQ